jgi:hypothetical protein
MTMLPDAGTFGSFAVRDIAYVGPDHEPAKSIDRAESVAWFTDPWGNILSVVEPR